MSVWIYSHSLRRLCLILIPCFRHLQPSCHGFIDVLHTRSFREDEFSCELYQTNLVEDANGNDEVVVVLTYLTYTGGYDNFRCPEKPTFDLDQLKGDPDADGMTLFVLQNGLPETSDPTTWDCLVNQTLI